MAALIAYYSRAGENYFGGAYRRIAVGNTEKAANMLAELTGGELYKIEQEQPYSEDYKTCIAEAKADLQKKARPEVLNLPDDLDAYDEIYLGYPNYWGTMPMDMLKIGRGVFVNSNLLAMAQGGITIGDHARIAANVQLLSNNHDPYDLDVLTCKPVEIGDYAWIGAGATVLPGVRVGRHAVIGAASVVTKDVPDYAVAVGNPARVIKMLDKEKIED